MLTRIVLAMLLAVSLAGEAYAGLLVLSSPMLLPPVSAGLSLHVWASALFGWTAARARRGPPDYARGLLVGVVALLGFPLLGMLAMLLASVGAAVLRCNRRFSHPLTSPERSTDIPARLVGDLQTMHEQAISAVDVEPLVDVLSGSDPELKRGAIDALVRAQHYRAVGTLRSLLRDPDSEIRLYASVTLGNLEDEIGQALLTARNAMKTAPDDPSAWEQLARLYVEYATCGFLGQFMATDYLDLAHAAYETARRLGGEQGELALILCRARLQLGQLDIAEMYLEQAMWQNVREPGTHLALMELAYRRGAVANVAAHAAEALRVLKGSFPQRGLVEWWAGS